MKATESNIERAERRPPTTFELAQLAVMVQAHLPSRDQAKEQNATEHILALQGKAKPRAGFWDQSVYLAIALWETAEDILASRCHAREQLKHLRQGLLTLDAEEWKARVADYRGSPSDIDNLLDNTQVETDRIKRTLFRDKALTAQQRDEFFIALIKFAKDHAVVFSDQRPFQFPPYARAEATTARECRHFVEARQEQIRINKSRVMPSRR